VKIVYISKSIIPSRTANSIHVMKMCQAFSKNGHDVTLLAPFQKNKYEKGIVDIYDYYGVKNNFVIKKLWHPDFKGGALFYTLAILFYLFFNNKFNLVYGRFLYGCYLASLLKFKVIFESHDNIYAQQNFKLKTFEYLIKSKYFIKLVVISNALKNMYLESRYLDNEKIQVAHDGADEVLDANIKIKLFGDNNSLKVGYVGHLYNGRGIDIIAGCAKKIKDATFHIVGGTKDDIEYWKNYTDNLGLFNIYFYGFVSPKIAVNYKNSFDILLAPYSKKVSVFGNTGDSSKFMSPLKIFEYMSHKKAIIVSDLPVLREVLNEKNSILVKSDDLNGWVRAINKLKIYENREKIANYAFNDFKSYTWNNRVKQLIDRE
jgi:glycosyltransferase involved in cell wall biosynthesis